MVISVPSKLIRGPSHSEYSKVVVPSKVTLRMSVQSCRVSEVLQRLTVVPSVRPVISRVTPAATVIPLRTMFEQEALEAIAVSASVKVQPASAVAVTVDVEEPAAAAAELVPLLEEDAAEEAAEALLLAFAVELLDFLVEVDLLDDFLTFWTEAAEPV